MNLCYKSGHNNRNNAISTVQNSFYKIRNINEGRWLLLSKNNMCFIANFIHKSFLSIFLLNCCCSWWFASFVFWKRKWIPKGHLPNAYVLLNENVRIFILMNFLSSFQNQKKNFVQSSISKSTFYIYIYIQIQTTNPKTHIQPFQ